MNVKCSLNLNVMDIYLSKVEVVLLLLISIFTSVIRTTVRSDKAMDSRRLQHTKS